MRQSKKLLVLAVIVVMTSGADAQSTSEETPKQGDIILITGASGTDEYAEQFQQWATTWQEAATASNMTFTSIGPISPQSTQASNAKQTDKERLKSQLEAVEDKAATPLWVVFIGHGTFARNVAKINLVGPDVSATELNQWLQRFQRPVVVVNSSSSSGPFVNRLSAPNRIIVTATRSGTEQNFARFGQYFADAIASTESDLDHDDEVSVQEAFLRASNQVKAFYETQGRLVTEHALLDDNADGKGTPATMFRGTRPIAKAKEGQSLDGSAASRITLSPSGRRLALTEQEIQRRDELEASLEEWRSKKSELSQQEYNAGIEPILIELARLYEEVEKR